MSIKPLMIARFATPTSSINVFASTSSTTPSANPTANPTILVTKNDPAFGILGTGLILTGLPSAFLGHTSPSLDRYDHKDSEFSSTTLLRGGDSS